MFVLLKIPFLKVTFTLGFSMMILSWGGESFIWRLNGKV
jgi:hypothetical protein